MALTEIVVICIAIVGFALLIILGALRLRSRESVLFYLILYTAAGMYLSVVLLLARFSPAGYSAANLYWWLTHFGLLVVALTFGSLTLSFLKKSSRQLLIYGGAAILVVAGWGVLAFRLWQIPSSTDNSIIAFGLLVGGWIGVLATVLIVLSLEFKKQQSVKRLNRLRYWLIATTLLGSSGLIAFSNAAVFNWAGLLLLMTGSGVAGYIILTTHTPDIKLLVGRGLQYAGVTLSLAGVLLLGLAATISIGRMTGPSVYLLLAALAVSIVYALIFPPLWRFSTRILHHIIFGKQNHNEKQTIQHYSQRLSSVLDMQRLGDTVINLMIETLGLEQGIVFVNESQDDGNIKLRPLSSVGVDGLVPGDFSTDSAFVDYFRRGQPSASQYDIETLPDFKELATPEREWLTNLNMELYVPIIRQLEFVGLLAFGPRPQGTDYYEEDVDLMLALANQTALAMDSARLFHQLATVNQEVGSLTDKLVGFDATKDDFLSIASHELRTPLTQIHGYSQMLLDLTEEELSNPSYLKTLVEGVARGSERMKGVVDLMFDVTEADVGDMRLFKGPVNLTEVIEMAIHPFLPALDERRIAFDKNGVKELPEIEADGTRLVQAFENLISNAIKYTPDGGAITVGGYRFITAEIGPAVEITVTDTGIGIAPEEQAKIFDKFYRVDDSLHHSTGKTKFKGAGPGLGLTLVKGIIEAHQGTVQVESDGYNEATCPGSKFTVQIPTQTAIKTDASPKKKQSQIETRHWRRSEKEQADQDLA
jgi:signal transduction histidine kinase